MGELIHSSRFYSLYNQLNHKVPYVLIDGEDRLHEYSKHPNWKRSSWRDTIDCREKQYKMNPPQKIKDMKEMIAEFAIFANSFIGEYLKINFKSSGLYRICPAKDWLHTLEDDMSGQELLNEIITNGIKAEYMSSVQSHDLVGAPEYVHFTSPIRRLTDCVCHYLLKYIHLKNTNSDLAIPFTDNQLEEYSITCSVLSKTMKNNQYTDTKFRMIQLINRLIPTQEVNLREANCLVSHTKKRAR